LHTPSWIRLPTCIAVSAAAAISGGAAPAPAPKPRAPATAGEVNLTVARIEAMRITSLQGKPSDSSPGKTHQSLEVRLEIRLGARYPAALAKVRRGPIEAATGFRAIDNLGRSSRDLAAEVREGDEGPVLRIAARGLSPKATALRSLEGRLILFPAAKVVRFHVPWLKDELPLTAESTGAVATLRRFQLVEADSTLWISVRPPAGLRVAPFELPGTVEARAIDMYGNLVNNGGITRIEQVQAGAEPEFRFSAPDMRRTPARLTLDVLCVGGLPTPRPFAIRGLKLPSPAR